MSSQYSRGILSFLLGKPRGHCSDPCLKRGLGGRGISESSRVHKIAVPAPRLWPVTSRENPLFLGCSQNCDLSTRAWEQWGPQHHFGQERVTNAGATWMCFCKNKKGGATIPSASVSCSFQPIEQMRRPQLRDSTI